MDASFEEKSIWIQLTSLLVGLGLYFYVAGHMLWQDVLVLMAYVPAFTVAVIFIVVINIAGHVVAALAGDPETSDERDRLISWRAESRSSWILGVGVIQAIIMLILSMEPVWVAHVLLFSLFLAEVVKNVLQLMYYQRGM